MEPAPPPANPRTRHLACLLASMILGALALAACAPAAGRPAVAYEEESNAIIRAIAQFGPRMAPPRGYNHFSIESIGAGHITLRADVTTAAAILGALRNTVRAGNATPAQISVTTFEYAGVTNVAVSVLPTSLGGLHDRVLQELDRRFRREQGGSW